MAARCSISGFIRFSFAYDILGAPSSVTATARFTETGVDAEIAIIMKHATDAISTSVSVLDCAGPNDAIIYGSKARIEIAGVWYSPTTFKVIDHMGNVLEEFDTIVESRGMQYQALEMENTIRSGNLESALMPLDETLAIMHTLDAIRTQIGLVYPNEK